MLCTAVQFSLPVGTLYFLPSLLQGGKSTSWALLLFPFLKAFVRLCVFRFPTAGQSQNWRFLSWLSMNMARILLRLQEFWEQSRKVLFATFTTSTTINMTWMPLLGMSSAVLTYVEIISVAYSQCSF